ncbi:hypothetical protein ES708_08366 [subsurface metagenome]
MGLPASLMLSSIPAGSLCLSLFTGHSFSHSSFSLSPILPIVELKLLGVPLNSPVARNLLIPLAAFFACPIRLTICRLSLAAPPTANICLPLSIIVSPSNCRKLSEIVAPFIAGFCEKARITVSYSFISWLVIYSSFTTVL